MSFLLLHITSSSLLKLAQKGRRHLLKLFPCLPPPLLFLLLAELDMEQTVKLLVLLIVIEQHSMDVLFVIGDLILILEESTDRGEELVVGRLGSGIGVVELLRGRVVTGALLLELNKPKVDGTFDLALNHIVVLSRNNFLLIFAELAWRILPHYAFYEIVAKGRNVFTLLTHLQVLLFEDPSLDRFALICSDIGR